MQRCQIWDPSSVPLAPFRNNRATLLLTNFTTFLPIGSDKKLAVRDRHCATGRKVAGSIPDGVLENVRWLGVNAAGVLGWQPCNLHVPTVRKSLEPQPPGALGTYLSLHNDTFAFSFTCTFTLTLYYNSGRSRLAMHKVSRNLKATLKFDTEDPKL
jgi:hypothetical protein